MSFQDPWYRYPIGGIDTQGTDTLREFFKGGYRYPKPWYRYPLSRTAELAGKTPPTAPNKVQRSPTVRITFGTIKQASKHKGRLMLHCLAYEDTDIVSKLKFLPYKGLVAGIVRHESSKHVEEICKMIHLRQVTGS
ncbi:hypothetical protein GQ457_03G038020 [Hibiscus cannabinus]